MINTFHHLFFHFTNLFAKFFQNFVHVVQIVASVMPENLRRIEATQHSLTRSVHEFSWLAQWSRSPRTSSTTVSMWNYSKRYVKCQHCCCYHSSYRVVVIVAVFIFCSKNGPKERWPLWATFVITAITMCLLLYVGVAVASGAYNEWSRVCSNETMLLLHFVIDEKLLWRSRKLQWIFCYLS